jgi:hypothetical protein
MSRLDDAGVPTPAPPRFALGWAAIAYALATLALAYPALAGGFLVSPISDQYIAGYPFREFAAEQLRATGQFPLWNPYLFGGMPYVAAMHGDTFYPTFLLRLVLPTDVAMTWSFVIHLWLAGVFTYVFLRAAGLGFTGALVGGLAYMLSGQIASYAAPGHDGKLYVSTLLPLFLWVIHRGVRDGRRWAWGLMALIVGFAVLSPHPQLLQYLLLAGAAYGAWLAFGSGATGERLDRSTALRRVALALGAVMLGALIGAIQFLPVLEYVEWSPRAGGKGWEHAVSYSFPLSELVNTYLPHFTGMLDAYWGKNGIHFHSEYLGAATLLLAGAAFGSRGRGVGRAFVWFWLGVLVISLLWALGGETPFYRLVYAIVPGAKYFRAPSTMYFVTTFAVAVLAGVGAERVHRGAVSVRYVVVWLVAAAAIALLATMGGLTNVAATVAGPELADAVFANHPALVMGAWRSLLFVAAAAAVVLLARAGRLPSRYVPLALAAVVAADLWSVVQNYWIFSPRADTIYAADPTIEYLKAQAQPGRVLTLEAPPRQARNDPFLNGDALMHHDQRLVLGYHGNEIGRYDVLIGKAEGGRNLANPNVWKLLNMRYLLTNMPEPLFPGMERVVGPVRNAAGTMVYLYRFPGENPAAWVTPAIVKAEDNAVLATLLEPAFDVRSVALFDTSAAVQGQQLQRAPAPLDLPVTSERWEPGHIVLTLAQPAPAGSALMVSENYYPGWEARVDGQLAPLGRAGFSLMGVALPEGGRRVELAFRSAPYEVGRTITLVALAASVLALAGGLVIDRRRRG